MEKQDYITINVPGADAPLYFPKDMTQQEIAEAVQMFKEQQGIQDPEPEEGPGGPRGPMEHAPGVGAVSGGITGAMVGGASPVPGGAMLGGILGSAAGHYGGQVLQDQARDIPQTFDRIASNMYDAATSGVWSGIAEGIPALLRPVVEPVVRGAKTLAAKAVGKVLTPSKVSPEAQTTQKILQKQGSPGLNLGQLSQDHETTAVASMMENIAYNSLFSRVVKSGRRATHEMIQATANDVSKAVAKLPDEQASKMLEWAISDNWTRLVKEPAAMIYKGISQAAPGRIVEATPIIKLLRDPNSKLGNQVQAYLRKIREVPNAPRRDIEHLIGLLETPKAQARTAALPKLTFDQAIRLKTALREIAEKPGVDQASKTASANATGLLGQLEREVKGAFQYHPTLAREYDTVSELYAQGVTDFKNTLVDNTLKSLQKTPGAFSQLLLKRDQAEVIDAVKTAAGPVWDAQIKPVLAGVIMNRTKGGLGEYSGSNLKNILQEGGSIGPVTGKAVLGEKGYKEMVDLASALITTSTPPRGGLGVVVALRQAAAIGAIPGLAAGAAFGDDPMERLGSGAAGSVLAVTLTPWAFGHLVANPTMLKALSQGILQSSKLGKPSGLLMTTLRQLLALEGKTEFKTLAADESQPVPEEVRQTLRQPQLPNRLEPTISTQR